SFLVSAGFLVLEKLHVTSTSTATRLIITIAGTTACWRLAAYCAPQTNRETLIEFYRKVRPAGPGWEPIRKEAGLPEVSVPEPGDSMPLALVGWFSGCPAIWSALFTVGNILYGRVGFALALGAVFAVSGFVLIR